MVDSNAIEPQYIPERRRKPRINCSYPAVVRGNSYTGMRFEIPALMTNMSANGMYLRMKRLVQRGDILFIAARLSTAPLGEVSVPQIAINGRVTRVEPLPDGTYGVAVEFHTHRFL